MSENVVDLTMSPPVKNPAKRPMSVSELVDNGPTNDQNEGLEVSNKSNKSNKISGIICVGKLLRWDKIDAHI